jgi:hypothetical protein
MLHIFPFSSTAESVIPFALAFYTLTKSYYTSFGFKNEPVKELKNKVVFDSLIEVRLVVEPVS